MNVSYVTKISDRYQIIISFLIYMYIKNLDKYIQNNEIYIDFRKENGIN